MRLNPISACTLSVEDLTTANESKSNELRLHPSRARISSKPAEKSSGWASTINAPPPGTVAKGKCIAPRRFASSPVFHCVMNVSSVWRAAVSAAASRASASRGWASPGDPMARIPRARTTLVTRLMDMLDIVVSSRVEPTRADSLLWGRAGSPRRLARPYPREG